MSDSIHDQETASYELLRHVAERARDAHGAALARRIPPEERATARSIAATWEEVMDAALDAAGVAGAPAVTTARK
jgi:ferritin-like metal-binding protein YciE